MYLDKCKQVSAEILATVFHIISILSGMTTLVTLAGLILSCINSGGDNDPSLQRNDTYDPVTARKIMGEAVVIESCITLTTFYTARMLSLYATYLRVGLRTEQTTLVATEQQQANHERVSSLQCCC